MARRKGDPKPQPKERTAKLPSRDEIVGFILENPDRSTKRDVAKAFNLKGEDRLALKPLFKELEEEGVFQRRGKRLVAAGALPKVMVLTITGRDADGGLLARPLEWNEAENGPPPLIATRVPRHNKQRQVSAGVGDRVLARISPPDSGDGVHVARVIKKLEARRTGVLGVVRRMDDGGYRLEPVDRKQSELIIDKDQLADARVGDLVEVDVTRTGRYGLPRATVTQRIGSFASEKAVSMIAIHANGIPHVFPQEVMTEAEKAEPVKPGGKREDWRKLPLITIDPSDAKDHDDAVHAEPDPDVGNAGGHVLTVAIADVAHYVRPGSALDREALKRGNSVYFPDRVVPMLPERISNDLCSLREGEDRPALAVRMVFGADGHKRSHSFHRIVMRSAAKLSYNQAQAAIDGAPDDKSGPLLEPILKPLWAAYACLKKGRHARGPLELDLPERKIILNSEGLVDRITVPDRLDAHKLIEECMIQANVAAAETLESKEQLLVYRVHDSPSMAKEEALREFLKTIEIPLAQGAQLRPSAFNTILDRVKDTDHAALVNEVILRSQAQAEYAPENYGHFGLNLLRYAHFTSPIRRYADLIVHRALIRALGLGDGKDGLPDITLDQLREIAGSISIAERRAVAAERQTVDRLIALHLADSIGQSFDGRVAGLSSAGLFVALPAYGADGFVPASTLGDEYFRHDEGLHAMVGERSGTGYRLGDAVTIKIVEVLPLAGSMRFEMETEPRKLESSNRSYHKSRKGARAGRGAMKGKRPGQSRGRPKAGRRR
ncbi:ribonuclease R [Oricola cellulosilytica]|uniref:Ribonuclease R n=1 Tax=Oricola cellulosilytica TaxID=1429082 RepID=A0A4V2MNT4_9HYPH|nr:ribonuclease R [Oricola cellulosilytica]TCD14477.1 ribonuclease R [Oricola cellulosilytica]